MTEKHINLYRNVFREEQARRRRSVLMAAGAFVVLLVVAACLDYMNGRRQRGLAELSKIEASLQLEKSVVETLSKAKKDKSKESGDGGKTFKSDDAAKLLQANESKVWISLGNILSTWSQPGTRFKRIVVDKGSLAIYGEAVSQAAAQKALARIKGAAELDGIKVSRVEIKIQEKGAESIVTFTLIGVTTAKEVS